MSVLRVTLIGLLTAVVCCCCSTRQKHETTNKTGSAATPAETSREDSAVTPSAVPAATPHDTQTADAPPVPEDFSCRVGQGGGITGLWSGYTLEPGGAVLSWEGRTAGEGATPAGRLAPEEIARLWRLVQEKKFMTLNSDVRGNMTYFLEVTAGSRRHAAYWTDMTGKTPDPGLNELRLAFLDALKNAASGK